MLGQRGLSLSTNPLVAKNPRRTPSQSGMGSDEDSSTSATLISSSGIFQIQKE